ncbi:MAG: ADP-forming succinate--CoA ligase subunit beta [Deltaproteobacteria bacterium]|nr:ADP-forming succinate--CoA ligase subunit beta [Deltaproteobacteria bacterium]RLB83415.1 MAG: ADP-forming succinate--CoA ligase subunit beta [Deltaproteobacteria bacterium]
MKIHEYQAKEIFSQFSIPVPRGSVVRDAEEARKIADQIGGEQWVVKAQIHAGGRGKGGGVRVADTPEAVAEIAKEMLGMTLVTPQTGPQGKRVTKVLVEEGVSVKQEFYVGAAVDRANQCPVMIASSEGGMGIEALAASHPDRIVREWIDVGLGLPAFQARNLVFGMGINPGLMRAGTGIFTQLYRLFDSFDCTLVEINPLVVTEDNQLLALDAKIEFDDNALFRHKEFLELKDTDAQDPLEVEASQHRLNYIRLEGDVGIMVNGAGLAMATMDLIKQAGARPANFLDVGGGATTEMVTKGFEIILQDKNVRGILINIFGGILRCDVLAKGVVEAAKKVAIKVPVVVRLDGTNVEEGRDILAQSGLDFMVAASMADAAEKVRGLEVS